MRRWLVTVVVAAAVAGCGEADRSGAAIFSCLGDQAQVSNLTDDPDDLDLLAEDASDLGMAFEVPGGAGVTVVVDEEERISKEVQRAYEMFEGLAPGSRVDRFGKVVVAYDGEASEDERGAVEDCVS